MRPQIVHRDRTNRLIEEIIRQGFRMAEQRAYTHFYSR